MSYVARSRSSLDIVRHGVPQGSILGPLLFYINDIPTICNNSVKSVLFADDTSLVISSPALPN
jgi:hypothetical protein